MKLPAHRAGLPGHAVASRMRAKEVSFILCPFLPAGSQGPRGARSGNHHSAGFFAHPRGRVVPESL